MNTGNNLENTAAQRAAKAAEAIAELHERYQRAYQAAQQQPSTEYMSGWEAPCYVGTPSGGEIAWRPVAQNPALDFSGVEHALEMPLDTETKILFSAMYAGDLILEFASNELVLLQVMCAEDGERLQKNLIGHVMMKQRLEQPITLFIGLTDEDDLLISVDNETGAVGLEYVGKPQHEVLAANVSEFLEQLSPRIDGAEFSA